MTDNLLLDRSSGERLRVAVATLWFPIIAVAFVPIVIIGFTLHPIGFAGAVLASLWIVAHYSRKKNSALNAERHPQRLEA